MDDSKLISNLDSITKQLQKIAATIGISVGITDKGGKPKLKATLDTNEKARTRAIAKETADEYKKVLGLGFKRSDAESNVRIFDEKLKITAFFKKSGDYFKNISKNIETLVTVTSNTSTKSVSGITSVNQLLTSIRNKIKNYTPNFISLEKKLSGSSSKDYTSNFLGIENVLSGISTNTGKDYTSNFLGIENVLNNISANAPKDYETNFLGLQGSLATIASNVPKDYEPYFQALQGSLTTIASYIPKDYEPLFVESNSKLESIKNGILNLVGSIPTGRDLAKGWDLLLRRMKWESFRTVVTDYFTRAEAAGSELNQKLSDLIQVNTDILNKKSPAGSSGLSNLGNIAGLMALGVGLVLIINALVKSNMIDTGNLLKVLVVVGSIVAMFIFVGKVGGGIKNAAVGFGILSATILFLIIPMMMALTKIDWETIKEGLFKLGVVFLTCIGVIKLMSMIKSNEVMQNTKGLALFSLLVGFLIIPLITHITSIPIDQLLEGLGKLGLVFGACLLVMKGAGAIKGGEVIKSMAGILLLGLIVKFLVIPLLMESSNLDWTVLLKGLANVALAVIGMGLVAYAIGQLAKSGGVSLLIGAATILALSFIVGYLGDSLTKVAGKDWGDIYKGLGLATLAIVAFGLVVAGIGALVSNPVAALLLGVGGVTILALSFVAGYLADSLTKFAGHDWNEITNGLTGSVQAMWTFGKTVAKMGALAIFAAPFMVAGGATLMKLAHVSGLLAANLQQFAGRPWDEIVPGLKGSSEGMWAFSKTVAGMGAIVKIFGQSVMDTGSAVLYDLSILAGVLANNLMEFADKPWDSIIGGLESSTVAMAKFGLFVAGVGVFSKLMEMGIDVVYKISDVIGNIAENLFKYAGVDQINFQQIGSGLVFLGEGLKAMFTGSLANVGSSMLDGITGFFKADPVSKIKKFETIDSHKIYELGLGLKYMGEGLRSLTSDLNLTNLVKDITLMAKPVIDLAYGISQFSDAYKKFQAVQMESDLNQIKNINVQNDNGIKDAITQSSQLQLDIMRDQLVELRKNNELMQILVMNNMDNESNGNNVGIMAPMASNKSNESYTSPSFSTKDHYRDNLKLMSMSIPSG